MTKLNESYGSCGRWAPEQLSPWCGPGVLMPTAIDSGIATSGWNYMMWMVSLSWAVYSVVKQASAGDEPHKIAGHSLIARFALRWRSTIAFCDRWIKAGLGERGKDRAFWFLFLTPWSMAFGYQFYAYSLFFRHAQVESTWSFGQIVAVMVWIPAIAEYIYLLRCETFPFFSLVALTDGIKMASEKVVNTGSGPLSRSPGGSQRLPHSNSLYSLISTQETSPVRPCQNMDTLVLKAMSRPCYRPHGPIRTSRSR